jgi:hypothetical protein
MKIFLKKIDDVICRYLGLKKEVSKPFRVSSTNKEIIIYSTFKRHLQRETWDQYKKNSIRNTPSDKRKELGKAIGQSLGKNLIISFDECKLSIDPINKECDPHVNHQK